MDGYNQLYWSIVYIEVSQIFANKLISSLKIVHLFVLSNSVDPDEMPHYVTRVNSPFVAEQLLAL